MSYEQPNYTQTPNTLFDMDMRDMGEAELKVVLTVVRKTLGYHKESDPISWTQIMAMSGLSRSATQTGIELAIQNKRIEQVGMGARGVGIYRLVVISDQSEIQTRTGSNFRPELVVISDLQKKDLNKNKENSAGRTRDRSYMSIDLNRPTPQIGTHTPDTVLQSGLVQYVMSQVTKSALISKGLQESLVSSVKVPVGNSTVVYESVIGLYDKDPMFREFVIERVKAFNSLPNSPSAQNILKNISKVGASPMDEAGNKHWPGYHYWKASRYAEAGLANKPKVMDYGAPPDEVQNDTD